MADLMSGLVVAVSEDPVGSQLTEAAAGGEAGPLTIPFTIPQTLNSEGGATVLHLDDVSMFNPTGGLVSIGGVVYSYVKTDDEASTLTLAAPLAAGLPEDAMVLTHPVQTNKTALVLIDDASDPIPATVPLNWHDALPVGIREEDEREEVRITPDGQWSWAIFDMDGDLVRDGSYIDPETLPLPDEVTEPPSESPLPTVYGAFGALVVTWEAPLGVTVDVYVSTAPGVPLDFPVATVTGGGVGLQWVRSLADGTAVEAGGTYWVVLVARNAAGAAPSSVEASGSPALVGESDINVTANMLIANLALIEALAAVNVHITGEATLQSLTALGKVAFRHADNELGQGSWLNMRGATTAPVTTATVTQSNEWVTTPGSAIGRTWRYGGVWHDGRLYYAVSVAGGSNIQSLDATGSNLLHATLAGVFDARGVTRLGTNWYVLGRDWDFNGEWRVRIFNSSWVKTGEWSAYPTEIPYDPAIGNDGTNILLARAWAAGTIHVVTANPSTGAFLSDVATPLNSTSDLSSIMRGPFDYGSSRTIITTRDRSGGDRVYVLTSTNARQVDDEWTLAGQRVGAFVWDGTRFRHIARDAERMYAYEADMSTTRRWVTASWNQGAAETTAGPAASYIPSKRKRAEFTFPPLPAFSTGMSVYVGQGATEPARTAMWRQVTNHPSNKFTLPGAPTLSGTNPRATSNYPGGSPSGIRTDDGLHYFDSTGALSARTLTVAEGQPKWGTTAVTTDADGWATITHGLGATPSAVNPSQASHIGQTIHMLTFNWTATTFDVRLSDTETGAPLATVTRSVSWVVYP